MREHLLPLIDLDNPVPPDAADVGGKAATLARLRRAGLPVPGGVVIPAPALPKAEEEDFESLAGRVEDILGSGPWAVRSSAADEDGEDRSFAGQYLTTLNVSAEELAAAVLRTHRSGESDRVRAYRAASAAAEGVSVLIQQMVDADAAGVAFTVDPVSGRRVTIVEAVAGPGEALVSGSAEPERWLVDTTGLTAPDSPHVLDPDQALTVAELASTVESLSDGPQDIEWALVDGSIVLLQARPITTVETETLVPIPIEVPPGSWMRDSTHQPRPPSPLSTTLFEGTSFPVVFGEYGVMVDDIEFAIIGGWTYAQVRPVGTPRPRANGPERVPPRWLLYLAMKLHPTIRRRARAARKAIDTDLAGAHLARWEDEWRPRIEVDIERALDLDLASLSDSDLVAELDHRLDEVRGAGLVHTRLGVAVTLVLYRFFQTCDRLLGWSTRQALELFEGLSEASTEPGRRMAALVSLASSDESVKSELTSGRPDIQRIRSFSPEFGGAFDELVRAAGHRALEYEVASPTLAERPETLLGLVAHHVEGGIDPLAAEHLATERREAAEKRARELLRHRSPSDLAEFEQHLARAREAYPVREDNAWLTTSSQIALGRYLVLEFGRRLAERTQIETPDDVFYVGIPDMRAVLLDGSDLRPMAREGKGKWLWSLANPGPDSYGPTSEVEPPLRALQRAARFVNEAAMWAVAENFGEEPAGDDDGTLVGVPASSGRYDGPARIVHDENDFSKIRPGDVVVTPVTSPVWSIVFPTMGALVTDAGGVLSHPAIIAREHGIPAVVGTGTATSRLTDGEMVVVDGDAGTVRSITVRGGNP